MRVPWDSERVIHAAGGVFIADEVPPGFGRTGEAFWGFMCHGVVPDMVPRSNGHPVAGMAVRPEVMNTPTPSQLFACSRRHPAECSGCPLKPAQDGIANTR